MNTDGTQTADNYTAQKAAEKSAIEHRRSLVATLMLARRTIRDMVGELERQGITVGKSAVGSDVQVIRQRWRAQASAAYEDHVASVAADLEGLLRTFMPKALVGDADAAWQVFRALDRKMRLLGLAAPEKRELSGPGGGPIEITQSPEQLRAQGLQVLQRVRTLNLADADSN